MRPRNYFLLCIPFVCFPALAEVADSTRAQAVSKDVYDLITQALSAAEHLESMGIDLDSIRAENLPFSSRDIIECFWLASANSRGEDEIAVAEYSCFLRHPISPEDEDTE